MRRLSLVLGTLAVVVFGILLLSSVAAQTPSAQHSVYLPLVRQVHSSVDVRPTRTATNTPTSTVTATPTISPIAITIVDPEMGELVGDALRIVVSTSSTYEVNHVVARVGSRETNLAFSETAICGRYDCGPGWMGSLSIVSLEHGEHVLTVEARDVVGNRSEVQRQFVHNQPPTLLIVAPVQETVARPDIRIKADCTDDDPGGCTQVTVSARESDGGDRPPVEVARGTSTIDHVVSLTEFEGKMVTLSFTAQDSAGQRVHQTRVIYVESSTQLLEVAAVRGKILDVQDQRILTLETSEAGNRLAVYDYGSGENVMVAPDVVTDSASVPRTRDRRRIKNSVP